MTAVLGELREHLDRLRSDEWTWVPRTPVNPKECCAVIWVLPGEKGRRILSRATSLELERYMHGHVSVTAYSDRQKDKGPVIELFERTIARLEGAG